MKIEGIGTLLEEDMVRALETQSYTTLTTTEGKTVTLRIKQIPREASGDW